MKNNIFDILDAYDCLHEYKLTKARKDYSCKICSKDIQVKENHFAAKISNGTDWETLRFCEKCGSDYNENTHHCKKE